MTTEQAARLLAEAKRVLTHAGEWDPDGPYMDELWDAVDGLETAVAAASGLAVAGATDDLRAAWDEITAARRREAAEREIREKEKEIAILHDTAGQPRPAWLSLTAP